MVPGRGRAREPLRPPRNPLRAADTNLASQLAPEASTLGAAMPAAPIAEVAPGLAEEAAATAAAKTGLAGILERGGGLSKTLGGVGIRGAVALPTANLA